MKRPIQFVALTGLLLTACQLQPDQAMAIGDTLTRVATALDRNTDGTITKKEVDQGGGSIALWTALGTGILSLLAGGTALGAKAHASRALTDVDAIYDKALSGKSS